MKLEDIIAYLILFIILFLIYSKIRDKSLKETWEEIVELFKPKIEE